MERPNPRYESSAICPPSQDTREVDQWSTNLDLLNNLIRDPCPDSMLKDLKSVLFDLNISHYTDRHNSQAINNAKWSLLQNAALIMKESRCKDWNRKLGTTVDWSATMLQRRESRGSVNGIRTGPVLELSIVVFGTGQVKGDYPAFEKAESLDRVATDRDCEGCSFVGSASHGSGDHDRGGTSLQPQSGMLLYNLDSDWQTTPYLGVRVRTNRKTLVSKVSIKALEALDYVMEGTAAFDAVLEQWVTESADAEKNMARRRRHRLTRKRLAREGGDDEGSSIAR
jgi:hypothetical protein